MASTSGCSQPRNDLILSDTSFTTGDSSTELDFATATPASKADHATLSTLYFSALQETIERSKAHWSTLVDHPGYTDEEKMDFRVRNEQEFLALQVHSTWGGFFANFTGDGVSTGFYSELGEVVVGKKFAEGGQAELYDAQIKWIDPRYTEEDERLNCEYVLKVFKEGTLLKHVKSQCPQELLQTYHDLEKRLKSPTPEPLPRYTCRVYFGILLKSGRFAFLMEKEHFDLRTLIEHNMELKRVDDCGPFSKEDSEHMMFDVALGVEWLHKRDIVHRDLKASNILVYEPERHSRLTSNYYVADYECSIGVVGTNFFRAPEILKACKERKVNESPEVFSKAADVYAYGMTCYEILTGKLPFEDHPLSDDPPLLMDLVINHYLRPEVPKYVEEWIGELLRECWQFDPTTRPRIGEILEVLLTNSRQVKRQEDYLKETFGENYRW